MGSSVIEKFEAVMMPIAGKISSNKYLLAMRDSFSMLLPFIIVGSFFGIMEWVVLDPWGTLLGENGMNLGASITGLTGDEYKASGFVATLQMLQGLCNNVVTVGFGVFSFLLVMAFSYRLGGIWGGDKFSTALTAVGSFIIMTPQQVVTKAGEKLGGFDMNYFGNKGVLTAIIIATLASWLFVKLSTNEKMKIKMPETVPPAVAKSFEVLIPVFFTLGFFTVFSTVLASYQFMGAACLNDLIYSLIQAPLMGFSQGLGFSILYQAIVWFFWWFGIHGHNVTAAIQNMVYMPAQLANQAGDASYVFSNGFFEAGLMHIMGLVIAILIFSKKESWRAVAKLGAPAMFFNIQEPIAFGLPIVLNPLLLVPYVLVPIVNTIIGYVAIGVLGIVPIFKYVVPWTMPLFFGGAIGTGSVMGGLLQVVWLLVDIVIYAPFVIAGNKVKDEYDDEEASV